MKVAQLKTDIRGKLQEHHAAIAASPPRLVVLTAAARSLLVFPATGVVTDADVLVGLTGGVPVGAAAKAQAAKTGLDALNRMIVNKTGVCLPYRYPSPLFPPPPSLLLSLPFSFPPFPSCSVQTSLWGCQTSRERATRTY
jgi:hypothetical protein